MKYVYILVRIHKSCRAITPYYGNRPTKGNRIIQGGTCARELVLFESIYLGLTPSTS